MPPCPHIPKSLPEPLVLRRVLRESPDEMLAEASLDGAPVAVRVSRGPKTSSLHELAALATLDLDGIARLVGHGAMPDGGTWVAREWISGRTLREASPQADPRQIVEWVARAAWTLEALHAQGVVHGDVSDANLIIDGAGRPVWTDFGFAVLPERTSTTIGTLPFAAPERLLGGRATESTDIFSLAAVAAICLARKAVDVREFLGRFPGDAFLAAADIEVNALPEPCRAQLVKALRRDPAHRTPSCLEFAHALQAAYQVGDLGGARADDVVAPRVPALIGRDQLVASIHRDTSDRILVECHDHSEAVDVAAALSIQLTLRGVACSCVNVDELAAMVSSTVNLDRAVTRRVRALPLDGEHRPVIILTQRAQDPWTQAASLAVNRATNAIGTPRLALVCASNRLPTANGTYGEWGGAHTHRVRPVGSTAIKALLDTWIPPEAAPTAKSTGEREALIERIDQLAGGSSAELQALLCRIAEVAIPNGPGRVQLPVSFKPAHLRASSRAGFSEGLEPADQRVLAAFALAPTEMSTLEIQAALEGPPHLTLARMAALGVRGLLVPGSGHTYRLSPAAESIDHSRLPAESLQRLSARLFEGAQGHRDRPECAWGLALLAGTMSVGAVEQEAKSLGQAGHHERVAAGLTTAERQLSTTGRVLDRVLRRRQCLALQRCGADAEAQRRARRASDPELLREIESVAAARRGEHTVAAERFLALGRSDLAAVESAHAALNQGDAQRARTLCDRGLEAPPPRLSGQARVELHSLRGLAWMELDEPDKAAQDLRRAEELARERSAPLETAAALINLAILERTGGRFEAARQALIESKEAYEAIGYLAGVTRTQSLLGGVLRQLGELAEAEALLVSALDRRARARSHVEAAITRGTLGLLRLERGHLSEALADLEAAEAVLGERGHQAHAELVGAAIELVDARLGRIRAKRRGPWTSPRTRALAARAAWIRGDPKEAARILEPAHESPECAHLLKAIQSLDLSLVDPDATALRDVAAGGVEGQAALQRAEDHMACGSDGRALRFFLRCLASPRHDSRPPDTGLARAQARRLAARCFAGLSADERLAALGTLLNGPDPAPHELNDPEREESDDMDVMTILELNGRLVAEEDSTMLLGAIVDAALQVTEGERGFIVLELDGELVLDTAYASSRGDVRDEDVAWSRTIVLRALQSHAPVRIGDAVEHVEFGDARSVETLQLRSVLAAPFTVEAGVRGVVVVDDRRRPGAFGDRESRLLNLLSGQAALAIRQVRRLEENRRLTAELGTRLAERATQLDEANRTLQGIGVAPPIEGLVGESDAMNAIRSLIHKVGPTAINVLVSGESGTGKEVVARALHGLSSRAKEPFVSENCAALPATLIESELFGATQGAYSGSEVDRPGLFERAHGGTLFLDEVGELPLEIQAKLLRVLETRRVRRLGDDMEREVDFRLVSATNRDLGALASAGHFRSDLMYRLDSVHVELPTLDERRSDIPLLVEHLLRLASARDGAQRSVSPEVLQRLVERSWPGNVRELSNEIQRILVLSGGHAADPSLVRAPLRTEHRIAKSSPTAPIRTLAMLEKEAILEALGRTKGDKRRTAELLGISRAKVYQRLKEWEQEGEPSSD